MYTKKDTKFTLENGEESKVFTPPKRKLKTFDERFDEEGLNKSVYYVRDAERAKNLFKQELGAILKELRMEKTEYLTKDEATAICMGNGWNISLDEVVQKDREDVDLINQKVFEHNKKIEAIAERLGVNLNDK